MRNLVVLQLDEAGSFLTVLEDSLTDLEAAETWYFVDKFSWLIAVDFSVSDWAVASVEC